MDCPRGCHGGSKVLRTTSSRYEVRRHRQCLRCRVRFFTLEGLEVEGAGERGRAPEKPPMKEPARTRPSLSADEVEMLRDLEKAGGENWDLDRAEKTLGIDLRHFNKDD